MNARAQPIPLSQSAWVRGGPALIEQELSGGKWSLADAGYPRRRRPPLYGGSRAAQWVTDDSSCGYPDCWQVAKVGLLRRYAVKAAVRPAGVVEREVFRQSRLGLRHAVVGVQIDFFVLDGAPQALEKDVATPATLAVHAGAAGRKKPNR